MNDGALAQLRDIHTSPPPGLWPPAPGWWLAGVLAGVLALWLGRRLYRAYCRRRRQRLILRELARLRATFERDSNPARFAADLSILLRRVALTRFPRTAVAGLSGVTWLRFLDSTGGAGHFSRGPGRVLMTAPYQPHAELDVESLYVLVKEWIQQHV